MAQAQPVSPTDSVDPQPGAEAPPKRGGKLLLLLPVVALLLGGGGGFFYFQAEAAVPPADEAAPPTEYGEFTTLQGIIVNPAGSGGRRYLMMDLALESPDAEGAEEVALREAVIRDAVIGLLAKHTVEELASTNRRLALKDSIRTTVNGLIEGDVDRLYITQYVLQ